MKYTVILGACLLVIILITLFEVNNGETTGLQYAFRAGSFLAILFLFASSLADRR